MAYFAGQVQITKEQTMKNKLLLAALLCAGNCLADTSTMSPLPLGEDQYWKPRFASLERGGDVGQSTNAPALPTTASGWAELVGSFTNIGLTIGYQHGISTQPVRNGVVALVLYNFSDNVGAGLGVQYFGSFQQVTATIQLQLPIAPLASLGYTNKFLVPWTTTAVGAPIAGSSTSSPIAITGGGLDVVIGHVFGGRFFGGGGYGNEVGAGKQSGSFILANVGWEYKF